MKSLIFLVFVALNTFAHPHFFIDVDINIDKNKIVHHWTFDRINSKLISFEFDKNRDKIFQENEKIDFYNTHILKAKENNFNVFLESNDKEYIFEKLTSYDLEIVNKQIVFTFNEEIKTIKNTTLCNIDPTIYMAFKLNNITSNSKVEVQKSKYDFCIGVL